MKQFKVILPFVAIGFIIACLSQSCKTGQLIQAKPIYSILHEPFLINNYIHDTTRIVEKRKPQTPEQLQALLKYNYDTYYAKDFKAIASTNAKLVSIIQSMRTVGIARQHKLDSVEYANSKLQKTLYDVNVSYSRIETKVDQIADGQKDSISNATWSKTMDKLFIYGAILTIIFILINFFMTRYQVNKAMKKANKI